MESVVQSDALIRLAFITGLASTAFTIVVLFWMTALRIVTRYRQRQLERHSPKWLEVLLEGKRIIDADLAALPRLTAFSLMRQWMVVMDQAGYLQDRPSRAAREEQLRVAADHARLEEFSLELLESGTKEEIMGAAIALGQMKASRASLPLRRYLRSADTFVSAASAEALVRINPSRAVKDLIDVLSQKRDWPEHVLARILRQIDPEDVGFIVASLARGRDYDAMLRLYRALSRNNDPSTVVVLEWLFKHARTDADLVECAYGAHQDEHVRKTLRKQEENQKRIGFLTAVALDLERAKEDMTVEDLLSKEPPVVRDHVMQRLQEREETEFTVDA